MQSYVNQVIEVSQKLQRSGFEITDEWIGSLLLAGLPEKFGPMMMAIEHSGIAITTDAIKSKLLDMFVDGNNGNRNGAFAMNSHFKNGTKDGSSTRNYHKPQKDLTDVTCFNCQQKGHYRNKCPILKKKFEQFKKSEQKNVNTNAFSAVFLSGDFNKSDWYIDSGASVHLTANEH